MPGTEEKLSPEEKLLRVIQGGDKQKAESPPRGKMEPPADAEAGGDDAPAVTAATAVVPPAEPDDAEAAIHVARDPEPEADDKPVSDAGAGKPKLALAKTKSDEPEPAAPGADTARAKEKRVPAKKPAVAAKGGRKERRKGRPRAAAVVVPGKKDTGPVVAGLQTVNKCLAAVILLVLLLTGWEILANAKAVSTPIVAAAIDLPIGSGPGDRDLVQLEDALDAISKRPIFQTVKVVQTPTPGPRGPDPLKSVGLLGISQVDGENEGIVQDSESEKMYFLHVGDKFTIRNKEFTVLAVEADRLRVTDGEREKDIK